MACFLTTCFGRKAPGLNSTEQQEYYKTYVKYSPPPGMSKAAFLNAVIYTKAVQTLNIDKPETK